MGGEFHLNANTVHMWTLSLCCRGFEGTQTRWMFIGQKQGGTYVSLTQHLRSTWRKFPLMLKKTSAWRRRRRWWRRRVTAQDAQAWGGDCWGCSSSPPSPLPRHPFLSVSLIFFLPFHHPVIPPSGFLYTPPPPPSVIAVASSLHLLLRRAAMWSCGYNPSLSFILLETIPNTMKGEKNIAHNIT